MFYGLVGSGGTSSLEAMEDKENAVFITPLGTFCMELFMFVLCIESVVCLRFD
jgi:hypothetical protein